MENTHLLRFNGTPVKSIRHLAVMVDAALAHTANMRNNSVSAESKESPLTSALSHMNGASVDAPLKLNGDGTDAEATEHRVPSGAFLSFEFHPDKLVVLEAAAVEACTADVCEENAIPAGRSKNLL